MPNTGTVAGNGQLNMQIEALQPWFHNLHLPNGVQTAPNHSYGDFPKFKWDQLSSAIPEDLTGWTALDIGCNAGFYSFELAKRGADVLGIDLDPHYLKQAQWAAGQMDLAGKVKFKQMQVYDLAKLEQSFDLVVFMGVFYHLRYPLLALDIITQRVKKMMVFQTLTMPGNETYHTRADMTFDERDEMLQKGWPVMAFIEKQLEQDPTNWWAPNHACIEAMLRTCGMNVTQRPGHEMYIAEPDDQLKAVVNTWNQSEYLSAVGLDWHEAVNTKVGH